MMERGAFAPPGVVPTEDAIGTLIEYFVSPLLPSLAASPVPPDAHQQEAVAKQMHAVVLLYNYYHRKQFPQLQLLSFESFCKSAVIFKPTLLTYMELMCSCEGESRDLDKQLSITEKMVMDACYICRSLDASKDAPNMENWQISKVVVFLIDSTKEKCLLQFGTITQGVWSLVEKDLDIPFDSLVGGPHMKNNATNKRKAVNGSLGDKSDETEDALHQLALSAVKLQTGIIESNLSVLEYHMSYSLTQDRMAARLYIMMYTEAVNDEFTEVPIKDVLSSLRGPLFKWGRGQTLEVTPVIEYYHLLPYNGILSDWLSRETAHVSSLQAVRSKAGIDEKSSLEPDKEPIMNDHYIYDKFDWNEQHPNVLSNKMSNAENETINRKGDGPSSSEAHCRAPSSANSSSMKPDRLAAMGMQEMSDKSFGGAQTVDIQRNKNMIKNAVKDGKEIDGSFRSGSIEAICYKNADNSCLNHQQQLSPCVDEVTRKNTISEVHMDKREMTFNQIGVNIAVNGLKDKVPMVDSAGKPCTTKSSDGEPLGRTIISGDVQNSIANCDLQLVPVPFINENHNTSYHAMAPKENNLLQASIAVLQKKRDELCQRWRLLEDEVARCEMNIHKMLNGGQENLMSNLELIIEACNDLCSSQTRTGTSLCFEERSPPQKIKRRRLSEAILSLQNPCQELDDICRENNWIMPRYSVLPSFVDGRFQANVTVQGVDFESTGSGGLKSSPVEARESAASDMLSKLRNMAGQALLISRPNAS